MLEFLLPADLSGTLLLLLLSAALLAGFIDAIAGGGGLITIPALLIAGFAPVEALGTNKVQGMFGSAMSTITYASKGHVDVRKQLWPAVLSFAGSFVGAIIATIIPPSVLQAFLPILLIGIAIYFAFKPDAQDIERVERLRPFVFGMTIVPLIGFYDGLFGPGTGSFFMLAFVALSGYTLLKATAHTKLLNFASNIGGFSFFAIAGTINWQVGLMMGIAQMLGSRLGATLAMRVGGRLIKPLLVVTCTVLAAKILYDRFS
ncbi:TSUP family transporter [Limoniibacter endophyticus]|uniref:Probable membrane transporter protein n=1 Tax=Limoniibacter endophyticus TaxID=1565040 RepID=A0A8J3DFC5_9HYPH|nr:TSUP family transporter [Limoniibacter endophyticus]GHC60742.1 UPF0721 transmembrane protein [Limoniibacter endophyticus]